MVWTSGPNSQLTKGLVRYEFIRQTHIKLITKPLNVLYFHEHFRKFFFFFLLGLAHLLNKPKTKDRTWFMYKKTNVNKLFFTLRTSYL